jgi:hypothetical protein
MTTWVLNGRTWGYSQADVPGTPYYLDGPQLFKTWHLLMQDLAAEVAKTTAASTTVTNAVATVAADRLAAENARTGAETAAGAATTARMAAELAQALAQSAKSAAETAQQAAAGSASQTAADRQTVQTLAAQAASAASAASASATAAGTAQAAAQSAKSAAETAQQAAAGSASQAAADRSAVASDKASVATAKAAVDSALGQAGTGAATGLVYGASLKSLVTAADVVAVCVYDTRRDSDGGAWAEQCRGTTWYNETLNTATRGATRRFPTVALIVARTSSLTIYDAHDLDAGAAPRMWMQFNRAAGGTIVHSQPVTGLFALNGHLWLTQTDGSVDGALTHISFIEDRWTTRYDGTTGRAGVGLASRNSNASRTVRLPGVASWKCWAVHAAVLPGAPLDRLGLPVPTVAVGTGAGVSVIHPWGAVVSLTGMGGVERVILRQRDIILARSSQDDGRGVHYRVPIPYASAVVSAQTLINAPGSTYPAYITGAGGHKPQVVLTADGWAVGNNNGCTLLAEDTGDYRASMVAYLTKDFATGWQPGDIRGAWLCDADTSSLVAGAVIADRCPKNSGLTVAGTLTRTAQPCGLAAIGSFAAACYLEQAWRADLDFGLGDFCIIVWVSAAAPEVSTLLDRGQTGSADARWTLGTDSSGRVTIAVGSATVTGFASVMDGRWHCVIAARRAGTLECWVDGVREAVAAAPGTVTNAAAVLRVGLGLGGDRPWPGLMALLRISASAPGPAQVRRIVEDERCLLVGGRPALLGGTSSSVTALAYNPDIGALAVGTPDGVSVFSGLARAAYHDGASAPVASDSITALAAAGPHLLIGTAAGAGWISEAAIARDERRGAPLLPASPDRLMADGVTQDATPLLLAPRLYIGERETVLVQALVVARASGAAASESGIWRLSARIVRDAGGAATLATEADSQHDARWDTGTPGAEPWLDKSTGALAAALVTAADTVAVQVTGIGAVRIEWRADISWCRIARDLTYAA